MSAPAGYARVAVALPVDGLFTYAIPEGMELMPGHGVVVPFGPRKITGTVIELIAEPDVENIKRIERLVDPAPALGPEQLAFLKWAAEYYLSGLGEVIATALPPPYKGRGKRVFTAGAQAMEALGDARLAEGPRTTVLREVVARPGRTRSGIERALAGELPPEEVDKALDALLRAQLIEPEDLAPPEPGVQVTLLRLAGSPEAGPRTDGARMRGVLARLGGAPDCTLELDALVALEGEGARAAIRRLVEQGRVIEEQREDRSSVFGPPSTLPSPIPEPNADQAAVLATLRAATKGTFLLHGVTGSGKTEVYLQHAATVLASGAQVLVLVPEIALTPQLCGRFRDRFGDQVAVLHSGLGPSARLREWRRIRAGEAAIAVGARSALFAPFRRLGLIVVDEEHDDSYKQDDGVRYHARDLAVARAWMAGCPVVLGSATPSLETWQNAADGRYHRLELPRRATPRPVPSIELIDQRGTASGEVLSPTLLDGLDQALAAGGKAIVLFNRRGYAPLLECAGCGGRFDCPSCGIGLVLHKERRRLTCHYCGFYLPQPEACTACGGELSILGHGTERVEELLRERYGGAGVIRMDADTTRTRGAHEEILNHFRRGDSRVLVGTQLVAKGHDFPDVHLAAVVGVDNLLLLPDFRSAERTYALVTQLAGRAGRGAAAGRVLVQTRHPDHFVFQRLIGGQDPENPDATAAFYAEESRVRRVLGYPPHARMVLLRVEGADREATIARAGELARALRKEATPDINVLGPVSAPMARLVGRWRFQLVLRGRDPQKLRRWLGAVRALLDRSGRGGVRLIVDVDPRNLL
jgi:primosomal protein N' (replication factor Y)